MQLSSALTYYVARKTSSYVFMVTLRPCQGSSRDATSQAERAEWRQEAGGPRILLLRLRSSHLACVTAGWALRCTPTALQTSCVKVDVAHTGTRPSPPSRTHLACCAVTSATARLPQGRAAIVREGRRWC